LLNSVYIRTEVPVAIFTFVSAAPTLTYASYSAPVHVGQSELNFTESRVALNCQCVYTTCHFSLL